MQLRWILFPGALLLVALTLGPARAGSPGSADRKAALPHVCQGGPLHRQACDPTLPNDCGSTDGQVFACVPDFRGKPTLAGRLWVAVDGDVGDNLNSGLAPAVTILLEIRAHGRRFRVVETFQGGASGPEIGNWLPFAEDEIEDLEASFVYQTPVEALGDVGEALKQVASQVFGRDFSATLPVFFDARLVRRGPSAQDEFDRLDMLGQAELFEVRIKFLDP